MRNISYSSKRNLSFTFAAKPLYGFKKSKRKHDHYDRTGVAKRYKHIWQPDGRATDVLNGYRRSTVGAKT